MDRKVYILIAIFMWSVFSFVCVGYMTFKHRERMKELDVEIIRIEKEGLKK